MSDKPSTWLKYGPLPERPLPDRTEPALPPPDYALISGYREPLTDHERINVLLLIQLVQVVFLFALGFAVVYLLLR